MLNLTGDRDLPSIDIEVLEIHVQSMDYIIGIKRELYSAIRTWPASCSTLASSTDDDCEVELYAPSIALRL